MSWEIKAPAAGGSADDKANRNGDNLTDPQAWRAALDVPEAAALAGLTKADVGLGNVLNVEQYPASNPNGFVDAPAAAAAAPVQSVANRTGAVTLTKSDVGLNNVANTSDANKPVSNATNAALNMRASVYGNNLQDLPQWRATLGVVPQDQVNYIISRLQNGIGRTSPPKGSLRMTSMKPTNLSVTVKHDGSGQQGATGICYATSGGTPVYTAVSADTALTLSIPHKSGAPFEVHIWPALSYQNALEGNLTSVTCGGNRLTSLDVTGIGDSLTELQCQENLLTSLDLSSAPYLKILRCYENRLTSLDLSGLNALHTCWCHNNPLTSVRAVETNFDYVGINLQNGALDAQAIDQFFTDLGVGNANLVIVGNPGAWDCDHWLAIDKGYTVTTV